MDIYSFFISNKYSALNMLYIFIWNFILLLIIIKTDSRLQTFFFNYKNRLSNNIQKIHKGHISRLGGIAIVITFVFTAIFFDNSESKLLLLICIYGLPLILGALLEDILQKINPLLRLISIMISSFIFFYFVINNLPVIDIYILDKILNTPIINIIFFSLALTGYINGVNFIDGTNGLSTLSTLASLLCLLFLSLTFEDTETTNFILYMLAILMSFLLLNYPFGKIFLGDLGAYFVAWFTGIMAILIMARNPEIPNWCAVCILGYPVIEVIFSIIRKILQSKNPFYPDKDHLHLKLFFVLNNKIKDPIIANSLVAPFLALIWLMPLVLVPWIYNNKILVFIAILTQIIIYFLFYYFIPKEKN